MSVQKRMWERRWLRYLVVYSVAISGFTGIALVAYYLILGGFNLFNPPLHVPLGLLIGLIIIVLDAGGCFLVGYLYLRFRKRK